MHKQHPQTAYRKDAVLVGTIFENCDKLLEYVTTKIEPCQRELVGARPLHLAAQDRSVA